MKFLEMYMMKRYVESFLIILIIACSCILECKARSKTWFYPDYIIKDANAILYWWDCLLLMLVIAILFILGVELVRRGKWKFAIIPFAACIVFMAVFGIRYQYSIGLAINKVEKLVMGTYIFICYGVARILEHGWIRSVARPAYLLFHVGAVIFCSWSYIYDEIYISPVVVFQMTVIFLLVYNYVFQSGKQFMSKKRKVIASVAGIIAFTVIFSFSRLEKILSIYYVEWLSYREAAFQTMITGDYSNQDLDPATMIKVKSYTMRWLGTAFGRKEQMIYILLLSAFLVLLIRMYCSKKDLSLKMVISAIVFSNLCGIVCEINLFYSAEVGGLVSRNLYQLIPIVYLAYINVRREKPLGTEFLAHQFLISDNLK